MLATFVLATLFSTQTAPEYPQYTAQQVQADVTLAQEALERLHPGYERYASRGDLDARWAKILADGQDGASLPELYLGLSALLSDIRCDHTKAELPEDIVSSRETDATYLPLRFRLFEDRMYVSHAAENSPLQRGDEIISIDGDPVAQRLAATRRFMVVDGYTDYVRDAALEHSSEFLGSGFDHFDALLNPDDDQVVLEVRHRGADTIQTYTLARIGYSEFRALRNEARWRNFSDPNAVRVETLAPGVVRLNVETFVNYRTPVNPDAIYRPIFQQLKEDGVQTLIVDLRRNGGGSTDAMQGLMAHLSREADIRHTQEIWVNTINFDGLRDHIQTWDPNALAPNPDLYTERADGRFDVSPQANSQLIPVARSPDAFEGDIIILTSKRNASGVTQMYGVLAEQGHVTLVGEPTGGSQEGPTAGTIWFLRLPHSGIVVRIPWLFQRSAMQDPEFGQAFTPNVLAPETYDSWIAGRDPALEAALDMASQ